MKKRILLILTTLLLITSCGLLSKKEDADIVESGDETEEVIEKNDAGESVVIKDSRRISNTPIKPLNYEKLSEPHKTAYNEIFDSALNFERDVILPIALSKKELKEIMNTIIFEEGELFHLSSGYGYTSDSSGSVSTVHLNYIIDSSLYEGLKIKIGEKLSNAKPENIISQLELQENVLNAVNLSGIIKDNNNEKASSLLYLVDTSVLPNSLGIAKTYQTMMRQAGVPSGVKVGQITSNDFVSITSGAEYRDEMLSPKIKEEVKGLYTDVSYDLSGLYFWNVNEMNGEWSNTDVPFTLHSENLEVLEKYDSLLKSLINVPDEIIYNSRVSYNIVDFLAKEESSKSLLFQEYYRKGDLLTLRQMKNTSDTIHKFISSRAQRREEIAIVQFENLAAYNLFARNFEAELENHSINNENSIKSTNVLYLESVLTVILSDIELK